MARKMALKKQGNGSSMETELIVLLDKSGSMSSTKDDAEGGLRELVKSQAELPGVCRFSLYQFDTDFEVVCEGTDISTVDPLSLKLYPNGGTALIDAMGTAIEKVQARLGHVDPKQTKLIFAIITDGEENSSKKRRKAQIKELVDGLTASENWAFLYIGSNQDAIYAGNEIGIGQGQSLTYAPTGYGTRAAYSIVAQNLMSYRSHGYVNAQSMAFTNEARMQAMTGNPPDVVTTESTSTSASMLPRPPAKRRKR